ncbi:DUF6677 family protein [Halomicroarcula sp. GCM10025817]|uniref:zinc ribbon domain-containing protein n=1 Tax=Haloarcula TaxID=2237 RepID=UPI0023E8CD32|nr:zinc ribbon domain-containing protein [Halomicroarcula sp. SYNS111]
MSETGRKRPWLAALLAFVYPGLGHVYLREWLRAILWFGLVVSTTTLLVGGDVMPDELSIEAFVAASQALPLEASIALLAITALSMADAYWMATQENRATEVVEGDTCPNCGQELDEDLEFCHWCTTRLQPADSEHDD